MYRGDIVALPLTIQLTSNKLFAIYGPKSAPIHENEAGAVIIPINSVADVDVGKTYPHPTPRSFSNR